MSYFSRWASILYYQAFKEKIMFIYSVRASTVKLFGIVLLAVVLTVGIILSGSTETAFASSASVVDYSGIKTNEDRVAFIEKFGIKVEDNPIEEQAFAMPADFDRVILGYNELQKKQGLDLSKYQKKKVTRYTYKVTNYASDGEVYANLFVYRGKIVACDLCSASPEGFVVPLTLVDSTKLK